MLYLGVCLAGLAMLWFRPSYGFALSYATGLALLLLVLDGLFGGFEAKFHAAQSMPLSQLPIFVVSVLWATFFFPLAFLAIGVLVVTLRKWLNAHKSVDVNE